jgi:hypothetical protein
MILSAAQPYFAPYPGFFEKMIRSDVFVLLDAVQFPRGGTWLTRNRFKNDSGVLWIRIPVHRKHLGLQRIDRVRIVREGEAWPAKSVASLENAYSRAPFFPDHFPVIRHHLESGSDRLADMNIALIDYGARQLRSRSRLVRLSDTGIAARGTALLTELCRLFNADTLLVQSAALKYLEPAAFSKHRVKLASFRHTPLVYPQLWGPFVGNLSMFDLLFCCGPAARKVIEGRR